MTDEDETQSLSIFEGPEDERAKRLVQERAKVGDGWRKLINELDDQLSLLLGDYDVLQIKEQYGGLRFYILLTHRHADLNRIQALRAIADTERESLSTCEGCGEDGYTDYHAGWYKTLCEKHHEELDEVMASAARDAARQWLGVPEVQ